MLAQWFDIKSWQNTLKTGRATVIAFTSSNGLIPLNYAGKTLLSINSQ